MLFELGRINGQSGGVRILVMVCTNLGPKPSACLPRLHSDKIGESVRALAFFRLKYPYGPVCIVRYKLVAGAASESAAFGYEPNELPHTLPGNKMVGAVRNARTSSVLQTDVSTCFTKPPTAQPSEFGIFTRSGYLKTLSRLTQPAYRAGQKCWGRK